METTTKPVPNAEVYEIVPDTGNLIAPIYGKSGQVEGALVLLKFASLQEAHDFCVQMGGL